MAYDDILITNEKKNAIRDKAPDKMPLNPTAQGWTGQQVRNALASAATGTSDSILSEMEAKLGVIKGHFETFAGNVAILSALPQNLVPYNNMYIFLKDENNNITDIYYVQNNTAIRTRFSSNTNVVISDEQPEGQVIGDLWYDIIT